MFIILKQWIVTIKVETDVNIDNEDDVTGMETVAFCVPQECEPEMSHILRWFLWWWLLMYIFVCGLAHMELLTFVDLQSCLYGALHLLQF